MYTHVYMSTLETKFCFETRVRRLREQEHRTRHAYAQIAQGNGGGKQHLRYRQAQKANRTDDLMVVNRLQGQKQILPSCWHVRLQASLRARPVSVIELCTPRARGSRRPNRTTGATPRSRLSTPYGTKDATQCQAQRLAKNTDARARTRTHARTHTHTHTHTIRIQVRVSVHTCVCTHSNVKLQSRRQKITGDLSDRELKS
jgi:hypothetical protein